MKKIFTSRRWQIFDLCLIGVWSLFTWNTLMDNIVLPLTLLCLRLLASFSLIEKKKSSWIPILLFVGLILPGSLFFYDIDNHLLEHPLFNIFKTTLLCFGDTKMDTIANLDNMNNILDGKWEPMAFCLFAILMLAWFLLYPVVRYLQLWHRKELRGSSFFSGAMTKNVLLLLATSILAEIVARVLHASVLNVWLFLLFIAVLLRLWKYKITVDSLIPHTLLFGALFFATYLLGRETNHFLSLFAVLAVLPGCYYMLATIKKLPFTFRDGSLLLLGGFLFWIAQFTSGILRPALLLLSAIPLAYQAWHFYRQYPSRLQALGLFFSTALLLPVLSIGYNPYSVLHARRIGHFSGISDAPIGILLIRDGEHLGLRDRYTEILPCEYDQLEAVNPFHGTLVKVRKGDCWGLYDVDKQQIVVDVDYAAIYPYDEYYLRIVLRENLSYFYQYWGYDNPSEERGFVQFPYKSLTGNDSLKSFCTSKQETMDNGPVHNLVMNHILSEFNRLQPTIGTSESYWNWAKQCTQFIHIIGDNYHVYTADTTSRPQQAVSQINTLIGPGFGGTQYEMNRCAYIEQVLQLYLTIENNRSLVAMLSDYSSLQEAMKKEFGGWLDTFWSFYHVYSRYILSEERYSALPLDLNDVARSLLEKRDDALKEEMNVLLNEKKADFKGKEVTLEQMHELINGMTTEHTGKEEVDSLRQAISHWTECQKEVAQHLPAEYREAYNNVTRNVMSRFYEDLKWLRERYNVYTEIWRKRAEWQKETMENQE